MKSVDSEGPISVLPVVELLSTEWTAVRVFEKLASLPHVVFFDSATPSARARYSYVMANPVAWMEQPVGAVRPFEKLASWLPSLPAGRDPELPPFQGGFAGVFGYELGASFERLPRVQFDEFGLPSLAGGLYDVVFAFDHERQQGWIISTGHGPDGAEPNAQRAAQRLKEFRDALMGDQVDGATQPPGPRACSLRAPQFSVGRVERLTSNFPADGYLDAIRRVQDYIAAGDVFQVNLAQRLIHPALMESVEFYLLLREQNGAAMSGYLDGGSFQVLSTSPERFVRVVDGVVETRPIKGTRPRQSLPEANLFAGDELRISAKDRSENVMIVDLLRNDLARVCDPESVHVRELCALESHAHVHHLVSSIEGRLSSECTQLDLLEACFPGGSVTGAPKIRAMEIISELERVARGPYCGCLGMIGFDGTVDSSILIRTVTACRGWWQMPVGGGITLLSQPEQEYQETWDKAEGMLRAVEIAART